MKKYTNYFSHYNVDPEVLHEILTTGDWNTPRNEFYGLDDSRSLLVKYDLNFSECLIHTYNKEAQNVYKKILPVIEHVQEKLGPSYCTKIMITNLPAGKTIKEHIDPGWPFSIQRRFHWSIETNSDVFLLVDGNKCKLKAGDIWEIDNKKPHSATNAGTTDRIHMIFDIVVIDEVLANTPAPFERDSYDDKLFRNYLHRKKKTGVFSIKKGPQ